MIELTGSHRRRQDTNSPFFPPGPAMGGASLWSGADHIRKSSASLD